ncbi:MAG: DUF5998 family protein [Bifidobacteriaceae bacterium]|jgi:hypothetical protein|nr:DUF5998 family protein [Bifidobacteriaceae bacterium]
MLTDPSLRAEVERAGYYPEIVTEVLDAALADEQPVAFYVHSDVAIGEGTIGTHLTVLAVTATRFITAHVDDLDADAEGAASVAASVGAVPLRRVESVAMTQMIADPASYSPGAAPSAARLTVTWGAGRAIDLAPADCGDPDCVFDHGYCGALTGEEVVLHVTSELNGSDRAAKLVDFTRSLSNATAHAAG